ncbi:MAG TPA: squalene/phytoene synthase family protein, partial [Candidatus Eisenbacteria bacterium]|nr:squalene/phytoene synthase family protein [Candidatus Eisenbacteria bacterium]
MNRTLQADRDYCRHVLPRVSRTFALNIRLLRGGFGEAVRTAYLLCRIADALEDSWPGPPAEVAERFAALQSATAGARDRGSALAARAAARADGREDVALVAALPRVLNVLDALPAPDRAAIVACLAVMTAGMSRYAARAAARGWDAAYLDTTDELHDYCHVVAGCVGEMLTRMFARRLRTDAPASAARRLALAPVVGEALQLTNVLLDWPQDVRRGRCHVPAAWLAEHDLAPAELVHESAGVRDLAARLEQLARAALARVPDYLDTLPGGALRYRLFCLWPARWARASLDHALRDPQFPWGPRRPKLPRAAVRREALAALLDPSGRALRAAA